jgi:hypothetical protein
MSSLLQSQGSALVIGINAFAPHVKRLLHEFNTDAFVDWPTVILTQTMQSTAVSIFKLLPSVEGEGQLLDTRSIATLVRNMVDTHDVIDAMVDSRSPEDHYLNRQILGYYIAGRIAHIQRSVDPVAAQKFFPLAKTTYWNKIEKSPLFDKAKMAKLKSGESVFYRTRSERVKSACGAQADFVSGILSDISTFVHSVPPALWLSPSSDVYADTVRARDVVAIWLRIANFYYARSISVVLRATNHNASNQLCEFLNHHSDVFSE